MFFVLQTSDGSLYILVKGFSSTNVLSSYWYTSLSVTTTFLHVSVFVIFFISFLQICFIIFNSLLCKMFVAFHFWFVIFSCVTKRYVLKCQDVWQCLLYQWLRPVYIVLLVCPQLYPNSSNLVYIFLSHFLCMYKTYLFLYLFFVFRLCRLSNFLFHLSNRT